MKRFAVVTAVMLAVMLCLAPLAKAQAQNFQTSQEWNVFLNRNGSVTKMTEDGVDFWRFDGIDKAYASAGIDVLPAIMAAAGEDLEEAYVTVQFDVRFVTDNNPSSFSCGVLLRAEAAVEELKNSGTFKDVYEGTHFYNTDGNVICRFSTNTSLSREWQTLSFEKEFDSDDLNPTFWKKWMLCFDRMEGFEFVKAIDVRALGIYLTDELEPASTPRPTATPTPAPISATPTPVTIWEPYNFHLYPILVAEAATQSPVFEEEPRPSDQQQEGSSFEAWWLIPVGAAVVIAAAAVVIVIKKKGGKQA